MPETVKPVSSLRVSFSGYGSRGVERQEIVDMTSCGNPKLPASHSACRLNFPSTPTTSSMEAAAERTHGTSGSVRSQRNNDETVRSHETSAEKKGGRKPVRTSKVGVKTRAEILDPETYRQRGSETAK